jgi:DNA-binding transcriptional LysR family regulator
MEHATQLAFVAAGLGAAIVPRLGRGPLPAGVCAVDLTPSPSRIVHALWREHATRRPATRAALDALEEVAARETVG